MFVILFATFSKRTCSRFASLARRGPVCTYPPPMPAPVISTAHPWGLADLATANDATLFKAHNKLMEQKYKMIRRRRSTPSPTPKPTQYFSYEKRIKWAKENPKQAAKLRMKDIESYQKEKAAKIEATNDAELKRLTPAPTPSNWELKYLDIVSDLGEKGGST